MSELTDGQLQTELRRITRQREALERRERELVVMARERHWSWDRLGGLLAISRAGLQKRYPELPGRIAKQ